MKGSPRILRPLVAFAIVFLLASFAEAGHCLTYSTTPPSLTCYDVPSPEAGGYYVDEDCCVIGCIFSIWIYQESNGIPGLQRDDEHVDDTCHGLIEGDTVIF